MFFGLAAYERYLLLTLHLVIEGVAIRSKENQSKSKMKKYLVLLLLLVLLQPRIATAQQALEKLKPVASEIESRKEAKETFLEQRDLFKLNKGATSRVASVVKESSLLELQPSQLKNLLSQPATNLNLSIPTTQGSFDLELYEVNLFSEGFAITTSDGQRYSNLGGRHYRGIIRGDNSSLAAISIFNNDVMGMIVNNEGNHVLGKLVNSPADEYVIYNDKYLASDNFPKCEALKAPVDLSESKREGKAAARTLASKCVKVYWEADYPIYTDKGSNVGNVINYLTGLFNQSKIIYDNDGISIMLSEIFVWTSPSPYGSGSSSERLGNFRTYRTSYNGNLANLLSYGGGGGVAYLNTVCVQPWAYGYCGISSSYSGFPAYSWSVMVVTHEQGHILGSQHTHDCVWNGNNTAIDACASTSCTSLEGSAPAGGGTIMSYCHLTGTGINLSKGFGPQPAQRIINRVNSSACTSSECTVGDVPPVAVIDHAIYNIQSVSSGLYVDVLDGSIADQAQIIQNTVDTLTRKQWEAIDLGEGYWRFVNVNSGLSLQVPDAANGTAVNVQQSFWTSHLYQQWKLIDSGNGSYHFINKGSKLAMDVNGNSRNPGARIIQWTPVNQNNQRWIMNLVYNPADSVGGSLAATVDGEGTEALYVYPNPAKTEVKVVFYESVNRQIPFDLSSSVGLKVYNTTRNVVKGRNEFTMNIPEHLHAGIYILTVGRKRTKIIVQR